MIAFFGLVFVVIGLIHLYLWKRLVRDPFRGRLRRVGAVVVMLLGVLVPATLIGVRAGFAEWLAWPGYLWIALMFYLFVTLLALEIPRLVISLWIRVTDKHASPAMASAALTSGTTRPAPAAVSPARVPSTTVAAALTPSGTAAQAIPGRVQTGSPDTSEEQAGTSEERGNSEGPGHADGPRNGEKPGGRPRNGEAPTGHPRNGEKPGDADGPRDSKTPDNGKAPDNGKVPRDSKTPGNGKAPGNGEDRRGIERRLLLARGTAIFAGLAATGITGYGVKTALGPPQLDRVQLPMAKLPRAMDGTRLAVVSDIHLGPLTGTHHAGRIVNLINSVDADIVCIVGDLVDGSVAELGRFAAPLADIKSRQGAYFVTGNHEYYSGYQEWVAEVARLGVRPLRNERLELGGLDLAGVNDIGGAEFGDGPDLRRALGDRDTGRPVVLMAHQPVVARDAAPFGVDLQVSGHTHGGQMAPFNLLVPLQQPVVSGFGDVDGVPVYVTNGAGFWGPPVRVGAPPQVTVIELRAP